MRGCNEILSQLPNVNDVLVNDLHWETKDYQDWLIHLRFRGYMQLYLVRETDLQNPKEDQAVYVWGD